MDEPAELDPDRLLARLEHTLTDGYAYALLLEGESLRLEREIGQAFAGSGDPHARLAGLADRRAAALRDLRRLRELLEALRSRTDRVRQTAEAA